MSGTPATGNGQSSALAVGCRTCRHCGGALTAANTRPRLRPNGQRRASTVCIPCHRRQNRDNYHAERDQLVARGLSLNRRRPRRSPEHPGDLLCLECGGWFPEASYYQHRQAGRLVPASYCRACKTKRNTNQARRLRQSKRQTLRLMNAVTRGEVKLPASAPATVGLLSLPRNRTVGPAWAQPLRDMVLASAAMQAVLDQAARFAQSEMPVLVTGETGVGKDLVARLIHAHSRRKREAFVVAHLASRASELVVDDLFGHHVGAYTDAKTARAGLFEAAHRGTLFLDEVGEMAEAVQVKLLRALEEGWVTRLGAATPIPVDVRIVGATNRALAQCGLRADLYHRLAVLVLHVPPLRERPADIEPLANLLATRAGVDCQRRITGFDAGALDWLRCQPWPGNVRELRNIICRAVALTGGELLTTGDLQRAAA